MKELWEKALKKRKVSQYNKKRYEARKAEKSKKYHQCTLCPRYVCHNLHVATVGIVCATCWRLVRVG